MPGNHVRPFQLGENVVQRKFARLVLLAAQQLQGFPRIGMQEQPVEIVAAFGFGVFLNQ